MKFHVEHIFIATPIDVSREKKDDEGYILYTDMVHNNSIKRKRRMRREEGRREGRREFLVREASKPSPKRCHESEVGN